jgi:ribonucleotide reductase beta subunit family protein with ferritin-like domain
MSVQIEVESKNESVIPNQEITAQVITNVNENYDYDEELLKEENQRFTVFPIKYNSIWKLYKKQLEAFWKAEEIDFSNDKNDYMTLNKDEQNFVKMVLAFFAASDGIVNFNLRERFLKDIKIMEAQTAYGFQMMMEGVHNECYSLMLENIIDDKEEREYLFDAIKNVPSIKAMADWALKWIESTSSFAFRLFAFAIVEGIFFSGAFASIFWLKKYRSQGKHFMNGFIKSNEFISRDEGMHVQFAVHLYSLLKHKLSTSLVNQLIDEAVKISITFTDDAIKTKLIGMNPELMEKYIKYIGDRLLVSLGYSKLYNEENPFDFMETIGMIRKTNFFEHRPTEYKSAYTADAKIQKRFTHLEDY